ncbi:14463_t:CDS:10, partial [Dentiscutata heterogama]
TEELSILPNHELIEDACQDRNPVYIKLQVPEITADINEQSLVSLISGEISLPWLLGFTNTENIQFLRGYIGSYFTTIFNIEKQFYQEEKEITRLINLGKRVANSNNYDQQSFKKRATQLKNKNWKSMQQIIHVLTLQELLEKESDSSSSDDEIQEPRTRDQKFQELMQSLISKGRLGLSVKIIITCHRYQTKTFYGNEKYGIEFSDLVAAVGLAGGNNHEEWSTMFVYAAVARKQNPDTISPTDDDLYVMQSEICVDHLLDNHNKCWAEICLKVQNPKLFLANPNLIRYTESQANALKEFLKKHTKLLPKQSLITTIRTSMNEVFNHVKLNYADKKVDFAKSFSARHGLAVLHNNNGLLEMLEVVRRARNLSEFSKEDQVNIGRIWKQREDKSKCNIAEINKRNVLRAKKIEETRKQIEEFDFSKNLIPYRIKIKDNIINQEFRPSFANLIPDFDGFILCEGYKYFPKQSLKGLCRLCYFYNEYRLSSYIINSKFHKIDEDLTIMPTELINSIITNFFKFDSYREFQRESIESFLKKQDTLTILPTGTGKTLIFSATSILTKALTIVFTPLKAIIECQLRELVEMGVPAAKIYAAQINPWKNKKKFLAKPAWTKLEQIKDKFPLLPILLLTATCSYEGASKLAIILKRPNLKDIIEIVYKNIRQNNKGRAIIYTSTPNKCIEIFNGLKEYVDSNNLVATNAFGMEVHISDVRIIIHTTFLLSTMNFVQEVGRAGRDGQQAKSIVLYSRSDIRELLLIVGEKIENTDETQTVQYNYLEKMKKNIFVMAYTFEDSYQCYRKMAYEPFRWPEDPEISECGICDNCKRCIVNEIIWRDISKDLIQILDTVDKLLKFSNDLTTQLVNFGRDDIENDTDKVKYDIIQTRNICLHAIDRLCVEELLVQNVVIKPIRPGSSTVIYSSHISGIAPDARQKILENSWLEAFIPC